MAPTKLFELKNVLAKRSQAHHEQLRPRGNAFRRQLSLIRAVRTITKADFSSPRFGDHQQSC
jgi:hypothetical protein